MPRRTPFSLALILTPFRSSQRSCAVYRFIRPRLLAVRTTQRRSGCQTGSLCSLLLCHAADKTSMHISLKERKDSRDFHLLSFSFLDSLSSFISLPPFAYLIQFHRVCRASFIFYDASLPLSPKHFVHSSLFLSRVSPANQSLHS